MVQQVTLQLGQGNDAVAVFIRAIAACGGYSPYHRAGKISRAYRGLALLCAGPEPAFLRAPGGADHLVIRPLKHVVKGGVNPLADHRAGVARVQNQHLHPGNFVKHLPQASGGYAFLTLAVGQQQRHVAVKLPLRPYAVGADVEVAYIPRLRLGEGSLNQLLQLLRRGHVVAAGDKGFQVHGAAGERVGHLYHIVGRGGGGVLLGHKAVAAHQQGAVHALGPGRKGQKAQPCQQPKPRKATDSHGHASFPPCLK